MLSFQFVEKLIFYNVNSRKKSRFLQKVGPDPICSNPCCHVSNLLTCIFPIYMHTYEKLCSNFAPLVRPGFLSVIHSQFEQIEIYSIHTRRTLVLLYTSCILELFLFYKTIFHIYTTKLAACEILSRETHIKSAAQVS